jgi:hypothetical protein
VDFRLELPTTMITPAPKSPANVQGHNQPMRFRKASGGAHPIAERLIFCLIDFRFFNSPEQPWHRPRWSSQASESVASNSPSKNAWRTSSQSEQAPAALMLDSGAGGGSITMHTMSLSEDISWLA